MSKQIKSDVGQVPHWGSAYVVRKDFSERIVGRVLGIIEAIGLPDKQETSVKELIRSAIYDTAYEGSVWINDDIHSKIQAAKIRKERDCQSKGYPTSAINLVDL